MTRQTHWRKDDRVTWPQSTPRQIETDYAVAPFDEAARAMDLKWGIGRLPKLVPEDMARKFGKALGHMNDCIDREDPVGASQASENCRRGLEAMDRAATAAGAQPLPADVFQYDLDGEVYTVARDINAWPAIQQAMPGARLWSMREVALALKHYGGIVAAVKDVFPNATISEIRPKTELEKSLDDEVPF